MSFILAIDGPAGTGKGTIAEQIAKEFGFDNFDTGAMYRALAYYMLQNNISINENEKIINMLETIQMDIKFENGVQTLSLNGKELTVELRTKEVNEIVSQVSHIPEVRKRMVNLQRKFAQDRNIVLEGRDIGTNVFPNANVKIYLDASAEERAKRRMRQNIENGLDIPYEEILENIKFRDNNDKTSLIAPLKKAEDAIYIDGTDMTIEETKEKIKAIIIEKR
ncbi:MAG: (d)CMP kinase [Clostridia bacterium]|nr:(d)CMP kinase [Clostridia bacterium]